jgi:hypothetical protein
VNLSATRPAVLAAFFGFQTRFEGSLPFMYLDDEYLVTTAIGCLVNSIDSVANLEWVHQGTGAPATQAEIAAAWTTVKGATALAKMGGGAFAKLTDLRLTPAAATKLVNDRATSFEAVLLRRFPEYPGWPADAQLGTLSDAWAAGPAWAAPFFDAAARALDWEACAGPEGDAGVNYRKDLTVPAYHALAVACRGHAWLRDDSEPLRPGMPRGPLNPGLRPRNIANKILFENAALTGDSANLVWPQKLSASPWPDYIADLVT